MVQLSHLYMSTEDHSLTLRTLVGKVISLLFNTLSRSVMAFLPRSKCLLILWLQSLSAVILETKKIKSLTISIVSHLFFIKWWDQMTWTSFFGRWVLSQLFHSSFIFIKRFFSSCSLSAIRVLSSAYLRLLVFFLTILIPACASSSLWFIFHFAISHDVLCIEVK